MGVAGVKDNADGVPTFWGTSGNTLQLMVTIVATTDFLLFGSFYRPNGQNCRKD